MSSVSLYPILILTDLKMRARLRHLPIRYVFLFKLWRVNVALMADRLVAPRGIHLSLRVERGVIEERVILQWARLLTDVT